MLTLYKQIFLTSHLICNLISIGHTGNQTTTRSIFIQDRTTLLLSKSNYHQCWLNYYHNSLATRTCLSRGDAEKQIPQQIKVPVFKQSYHTGLNEKKKRKILWFNPLSTNMLKLILEELFLIYSKNTFPSAIADTKSATKTL